MVLLKPYQPCFKSYEQYYMNQAGHGMNYYIGRPHQRGRNFASVLRGLGRVVLPLIKSSGKKIGKKLLNEGINTGVQLVQDIASGKNVKSAVKRRTKQAGKRLFNQAFGQLTSLAAPPGQPVGKRIKRNLSSPRRHSKKRQRRGNNHQDIFH